MLALPLRLPTPPYGGHMGHFLLSTLMLSGSAPFGNMASLSVELNSNYLVIMGSPFRRSALLISCELEWRAAA